MIRVFLIVVALGVVLVAGGVVYLGVFPPNPGAAPRWRRRCRTTSSKTQ